MLVNSVLITAVVVVSIAAHVVYGLFLVKLPESHLKFGVAEVVARVILVVTVVLMPSVVPVEIMQHAQ
jgi:hypothetical protein